MAPTPLSFGLRHGGGNRRWLPQAAILATALVGAAVLLSQPPYRGRRGLEKAGRVALSSSSYPSSSSDSAAHYAGSPRAFIADSVDGVCSNAAPYAKMYDPRPGEIRAYEEWIHSKTEGRSFDRELPPLRTLPEGSSFAAWKVERGRYRGAWPVGSAWTPDGTDVEMPPEWATRGWQPHDEHEFKELRRSSKTIVVKGDAAAWFGFLPRNFGHVLHENLPRVAHMRATLPSHTQFLLPNTEMFRKLVEFIDPTFLNRVVWYEFNDVYTVEGGTLTVCMIAPNSQGGSGLYNHLLMPYLRRWIMEQHPPTNVPGDDERTVIYATRRHSTARRVVEEQHEQDILEIIRRYKDKYGIPGKIELFNGKEPDGSTMSFEKQMAYFRRARYIIGPHGSALANIVWADPSPSSCEDRVKLLEFIPASDSKKVQPQPWNGYYWVLGGLPIEWSQVTYAPNSTLQTTYIRLPSLEQALDDMFGGERAALGERR